MELKKTYQIVPFAVTTQKSVEKQQNDGFEPSIPYSPSKSWFNNS